MSGEALFIIIMLGLVIIVQMYIHKTTEEIVELQKQIIESHKRVRKIQHKQIKTLSFFMHRVTEIKKHEQSLQAKN